jgi:hypothetical protein
MERVSNICKYVETPTDVRHSVSGTALRPRRKRATSTGTPYFSKRSG